jgi:hypothetical protein
MFPLSFQRADVVFVVFEEEGQAIGDEGYLEEFVQLHGSEEGKGAQITWKQFDGFCGGGVADFGQVELGDFLQFFVQLHQGLVVGWISKKVHSTFWRFSFLIFCPLRYMIGISESSFLL